MDNPTRLTSSGSFRPICRGLGVTSLPRAVTDVPALSRRFATAVADWFQTRCQAGLRPDAAIA